MHPEDRTPDYHFYSERGLITALSATLLAMAGAFSLATLITHIKTQHMRFWPWLIMALGFTFLALDETAQFHERLGDVLDETSDSGMFRTFNDVIVIIYGAMAVPVSIALLPSIVRYRATSELFAAAFVFYLMHTVIDSVTEPATTTSIIVEESAKLFCGLFLALSMLFSFVGALWDDRDTTEASKLP
jgi:hypothetical protein